MIQVDKLTDRTRKVLKGLNASQFARVEEITARNWTACRRLGVDILPNEYERVIVEAADLVKAGLDDLDAPALDIPGGEWRYRVYESPIPGAVV